MSCSHYLYRFPSRCWSDPEHSGSHSSFLRHGPHLLTVDRTDSSNRAQAAAEGVVAAAAVVDETIREQRSRLLSQLVFSKEIAMVSFSRLMTWQMAFHDAATRWRLDRHSEEGRLMNVAHEWDELAVVHGCDRHWCGASGTTGTGQRSWNRSMAVGSFRK